MKPPMVMKVKRPESMPVGAKKGILLENVPVLLVSKDNEVIYYEFGRNLKNKKNVSTWLRWKIGKRRTSS